MNPSKIKVDLTDSGERVKGGLSSDNEIRYYTWMKLSSESGYLVESEEAIVGEKSPINKEFRSFIIEIFRIPGVNRLWVDPNAIHVKKIVAADWHTDELDGVHDLVCAAFKEVFRTKGIPGQFEVKPIIGNKPNLN